MAYNSCLASCNSLCELTGEQKKELTACEKEVNTKLDKILTAEQKKQLKAGSGFGPGAMGGPPQPGQIMTPFMQARLKLTAEQKKNSAELQKKADGKLEKLLTAEQKKQDQGDAIGPWPEAVRGGDSAPVGGVVLAGRVVLRWIRRLSARRGGSSLFRASRYAANYPGLDGKDLKPGKTIEEIEAKKTPKGSRVR